MALYTDGTTQRSWADIVADKANQTKKYVPNGKTPNLPPVKCAGIHCTAEGKTCNDWTCSDRLHLQLVQTKADNASLTATLASLLPELDKLRVQIDETCKLDEFHSPEMESSRLAVLKTRRLKVEPSFCECDSCRLVYEKRQNDVLNEKVTAVQRRLTALRECRRAYDKETLARTSSSFAKSKYFTPVGSRHAGGAVALRPMLQMQSSYNVPALTNNTMASRQLKPGWKDKPKPLQTAKATKGSERLRAAPIDAH